MHFNLYNVFLFNNFENFVVLLYNLGMKNIKLSIFDNFKCLTGDCKDSCCSAGWQIDIDKKTMQKYSFCDDIFVQNIRKHIVQNGKDYCIKCDANGDCPFFRKDGLCDIVKNKGDAYLGEVCRNFPRVNNFVGGRLEQTLSFACEEVVRLAFEQEKINFKYENIKKDFLLKDKNFAYRDNLINYVQNKEITFQQKLNYIKKQCGYSNIDFKNIKQTMKNCEWLKNNLSRLNFENKVKNTDECQKFCLTEKQLENILVCYLFRYLLCEEYKFSVFVKLRFCIFSVLFCDYLAEQKQHIGDKFFDINAVKEYSREIENSVKNMEILLKFFNF